jgi:hypothetical protein
LSQPKVSLSKFIRSMKHWISVLTVQFCLTLPKSSCTTLLLKIDLANFVPLRELSSVALLITESFFQLHLSQTWPNLKLSSRWAEKAQASQAKKKMLRKQTVPLSYLSVMILEWWTHTLIEFKVGFLSLLMTHILLNFQ